MPSTSTRIALIAAAFAVASCSKQDATTNPPTGGAATQADTGGEAPPPAATPEQEETSERLAGAIAGAHRSADNKVRDAARHPAETLAFFGVQASDHIVELWPGGGWYTEILAPLTKDRGQLTVTLYDKAGPAEYYGTGQAQRMLERIAAEPAVFGGVRHVVIPQTIKFNADKKVESIELQPFTLGPDASADVVLTFRNSHGWFKRDAATMVYGAAFKVLKPGGTFGVVQHRAAEDADPAESSKAGYLPEGVVIEAVTAAGFVLEEKSEINANPKDTRDYPEGVWTLPPSLSLGDQDRDKYIAIGESDRMTLRFRKPK